MGKTVGQRQIGNRCEFNSQRVPSGQDWKEAKNLVMQASEQHWGRGAAIQKSKGRRSMPGTYKEQQGCMQLVQNEQGQQ
jgi:hypothetical protein